MICGSASRRTASSSFTISAAPAPPSMCGRMRRRAWMRRSPTSRRSVTRSRSTASQVLGDSYGGMIAMAYAAAHPEHVSRLILSDSPAPSWKTMVHLLPQVFPDREEQGEADGKKLAADPEAAAQAGLVNHMRMMFYSPEMRDTYVSHMGDLGFVPAVGEAVQKATENLDLTPKLAGFHFPTLVLTGRYDMNVAPLTAWRMAHPIPGAQIVFFEKSGHLPAFEEPGKYLEVLETFLAPKS